MTVAGEVREVSAPHASDAGESAAAPWVQTSRLHCYAPTILTLLCAASLWLISLGEIDPDRLTDLGLFSILPWTTWAALALTALSFALSIGVRRDLNWLPFLPLSGLTMMLHGTPAIAYGTLRYSWAWKHIGIVDFLQRHGAPDPRAEFLSVYHNWPGFFSFFAVLCNLLGIEALQLASAVRFFPLALNLCWLLVLPWLIRRLTKDDRLVWTATAVFLVGNWVGQDYFSPQGTSYFLYLLLLVLIMHLPQPVLQAPGGLLGQWRAAAKRWVDSGVEVSVGKEAPVPRVAATLAAFFLIISITVSHQLTPLVVISALVGLAVLGRISMVFATFSIFCEALWVFYFADVYVAEVFPDLISEFGNTADAAFDKMVDLETVSSGQVLVSIAARGATSLVLLVAIIGGVRRLLVGVVDASAVILALAPMPLLAATSYGGEIIFRLYFLGLPFLSFFAAAAFFPHANVEASLRRCLLTGIFIFTLAVGFVLANNGKDRQYRFSRGEVSASEWLYSNASPGTLLIEGSRSYPSQFLNYENFTYVPIAQESPASRAALLANPASVLSRWLEDAPGGGFVILTESQQASVEDLGIMPKGALDRIEEALLASPRFMLVHSSADSAIFALNPATALGRFER